MRRVPILILLLVASFAQAQTLSVPPDSPRWDLQANAKVAEFQGKKALMLNGGAASLKDFIFHDGVIDVDVASKIDPAKPNTRGFVGFQFRITKDGNTAEELYYRPHKTSYPDALQYTPIFGTGRNWQIYNGDGFTAAVDLPRNEWFHLRLEVSGAQAKLYVKDMTKPALVMDDLKTGVREGEVALFTLTGETYFTNFQVTKTPDAPWQRHGPEMPANSITNWSLSPQFDALSRNVEAPLTAKEMSAMKWDNVEAEPPGFVVIQRYRQGPHIAVTFANDFSKRLEPQKGTQLVYARTIIESDRDQVKKLEIGYSDEVTVFLNGKPLWRGRSAQNFRDPGFLGIMDPDNDAVYLPLKKGKNELVLAVSELGGGWGFICRLK
jgi:hypothetical protein